MTVMIRQSWVAALVVVSLIAGGHWPAGIRALSERRPRTSLTALPEHGASLATTGCCGPAGPVHYREASRPGRPGLLHKKPGEIDVILPRCKPLSRVVQLPRPTLRWPNRGGETPLLFVKSGISSLNRMHVRLQV
jgi:hypothetical protein